MALEYIVLSDESVAKESSSALPFSARKLGEAMKGKRPMEFPPSEGTLDGRDDAPSRDERGFQESIELVRRAQSGDREALNLLFARYQARLHRIARIRMGARLREVMESIDLVQQANEVALRNFKNYEIHEHAGIVHWLEKILENQMRDARKGLRTQKRDKDREVPHAHISDPSLDVLASYAKPLQPTPSQEAYEAELERLYDECVEVLKHEHREVILLRDYEGGSWDYVCERLGSSSVHAAQELHRRAKIKLAGEFDRRGGGHFRS